VAFRSEDITSIRDVGIHCVPMISHVLTSGQRCPIGPLVSGGFLEILSLRS